MRITTTTTAIPTITTTTTSTPTPTTTTTTVQGGEGPPPLPPTITTTTVISPPVNPTPDPGPPGSNEAERPKIDTSESNGGPPGSNKKEEEETGKPPAPEEKGKPPAEEVVKPPFEETSKTPKEETKPAEETNKPSTEETKKPAEVEAPKAPTTEEANSEPPSSGPPGSNSGTLPPGTNEGGGGGGPPGSKRVHDTPPASAAEEKLLSDEANEQKTPMRPLPLKKNIYKKPKVKGLSQEEGDHFKVYITDDGDSKESDENENPLKIQSGSNKHGYRDLDKEQRVGNYRKFHGNPTYHSSSNIESDKQRNDAFGKPMHTLQKYIEESSKEENEEKGEPLVPSKKHHDVFEEENTLQEQERIYKGETTPAELAASSSNNMADQETEIENIYKTMHKQEHKFDRKVLPEPKAPRVETEEEKVFSSSMRQKDKSAKESPSKEMTDDANIKEYPISEDINVKETPDKKNPEENSKGNVVESKASKHPSPGGDGHKKSADDVFDMPDEVPADSSLDSYEKHIMRDKHGRTKPTGRADSKDDIVELLKQYGKLKEEVTELTKESADAILPVMEYNGRRKSERSRSPTSAKRRSKSPTPSRHNNY